MMIQPTAMAPKPARPSFGPRREKGRGGAVLVLALLSLGLAASGPGGCASAGRAASHASGSFASGAVAADHHAASEAGAEMLRRGGNAVDAAVATSFALSVVRPYSCGIGGGGFMIIHLGGRDGGEGGKVGPAGAPRTIALDYRETAPAAVDAEFFAKGGAGGAGGRQDASTTGARAVATPGTVAGLLYALERYGTMSRAEVLAPAIRLAEEGFAVDAHYMESVQPLLRRFGEDPELQERFGFMWRHFLREGQVAEGDLIQLPEGGQARALRLIAEHGTAAFYEGPLAEAIVSAINRDARWGQGALTAADLGTYWIAERAPLEFTYTLPGGGAKRFITMPPPSSGGIVMVQALGIEGLLAAESRAGGTAGPSSRAAALHRLVESLKHAFADRAEWLGDPDHADVPIARLTSSVYLAQRAAAFNLSATLPAEAYGTRPELQRTAAQLPDDSGTSHLSVVDRWGNAVACTETINLTFGSLLAVEEFGFILNNEMDDFTARRGQANAFGLRQSGRNLPEARKRPLSSMSPTIVLDAEGRVEIVAGGAGGPRIITATLQTILNALDGMDAPAAVAAPRFHHQWLPDRLQMEPGLAGAPSGEDRPLAEALAARGHRVEPAAALANVQAIVRDRSGRGWTAASDPRKGGRPAGH
jgi:gamma-glutamyltranspeptidase / glutathione hydrolase